MASRQRYLNSEWATKTDLAEFRKEAKMDLAEFRKETKEEIVQLRRETKEEIRNLENRISKELSFFAERLTETEKKFEANQKDSEIKLIAILDRYETKNAAEREASEKRLEAVRSDSRISRNWVIGTCIAILGLIVTAVGVAAGFAAAVLVNGITPA